MSTSEESTRYGPNSEEYVHKNQTSYVWRELENIKIGDTFEWNHDVIVTSVEFNGKTWCVHFKDAHVSTGVIQQITGKLKVRVS